ncbi:MAG: hypothetical protein GY861_22350 [bacterium]|nr:hypothetical protein [bacterium]
MKSKIEKVKEDIEKKVYYSCVNCNYIWVTDRDRDCPMCGKKMDRIEKNS